MLLVVPEVPGMPSKKPLIMGFGCRLGGDTLSCEALFAAKQVPAQVLAGELHARHKPPQRVLLDWSPIEPDLYRNASIDVREEP